MVSALSQQQAAAAAAGGSSSPFQAPPSSAASPCSSTHLQLLVALHLARQPATWSHLQRNTQSSQVVRLRTSNGDYWVMVLHHCMPQCHDKHEAVDSLVPVHNGMCVDNNAFE